ncbi:hypothetical protein CEUSTIGMA_g6283.t1 [Chlamydomonas eustigma]|uniref:histidine kinase n=1 Tax=Chlamydomonas eustigma TaxID=1157962 RepID=A0A250X704_9CHLO|nr:hypothetical protein CEUSTIGMA_g6283.t1 [Chlamydomonas eustigma]|eukprot:GAX78845.1 hypothetical protein CEUSTIGMA_g6283.t1 [Chlamydomonas eustigma]
MPLDCRVIFETNGNKLTLHLVSCYINLMAASSYAMLWTGFSPILPDVQSCLYIPQRWVLYVFTAPAIIFILSQISDYSPRMRLWVILLNVFMLGSGGMGTIPWISWPHKVFWYVTSCVPFPSILVHMWRMVTSAVEETPERSAKRSVKFIRIFSITTWNLFPIVYFGAIDGSFPLEVIEPLWAALDWLTKMVYSSSLMEANFFTIAQRREYMLKAVEEANRLQTIQQLSNAIERKDDFLSTMSHELRTPLNGIIGLSESLIAGSAGQLPEKAIQTISTVKLSGKRLLQLINDILDAAKMKQGILVIKHENVDIKRLVTDVLDLSLPLVRKTVRLVNNVGNVPKIVGDTGRIVQVLYNLVGNAAKFTRTGTIAISAGVSDDGQRLYISVADTGVGIPRDKIDHVFGAFEQADMSTTRRYGGTGLGLHLVKELVKAHNGEITVESEMSLGSTFTVWLPLRQDGSGLEDHDSRDLYGGSGAYRSSELSNEHGEKPESGGTGSPRASHLKRGKRRWNNTDLSRRFPSRSNGRGGERLPVMMEDSTLLMSSSSSIPVAETDGNLLAVTKSGFKVVKQFYREKHGSCMVLSVDDDPINQMVVENLLVPDGYKVEQAMNGSEALEFLTNCDALPDVILLDVMMPDMSGYEVCQEIRSRYSSISIPIIMVSAKSNPEHIMKGLEAGSVDYVKKPFHRHELLSRVRAQVRNREVFEAEVESRKLTDRLKAIMPMSVVHRLQAGQSMIADAHAEVSVLFADIAGFWAPGSPGSGRTTADVVMLMNEMYSLFEALLNKHQLFRVEHTGEAYMVVSGHDGNRDHVKKMLALAQDMLSASWSLRFPGTGEPVRLRVGLHCGPAYAGVVGVDNPRYCVFGDTVLIASSLETSAWPHTIQVSDSLISRYSRKERFVPFRSKLIVGTQTVATHLCKLGDFQSAVKALQEGLLESRGSESGGRSKSLEVAAISAMLAGCRDERNRLQTQLVSLQEEQSATLRACSAAESDVAKLKSRLCAVEKERQRLNELVASQEAAIAASAAAAAAPAHSMSGHAHGSPSMLSNSPLRGPLPAGRSRKVTAGSVAGSESLYAGGSEMMPLSNKSAVASQMVANFWNMTYRLDTFLKDIGLEQYYPALAAHEVTPLLLSKLSNKELMELGVETFGARRRILQAALEYRLKMESMSRMMIAYKDSGDHPTSSAAAPIKSYLMPELTTEEGGSGFQMNVVGAGDVTLPLKSNINQ